MKLRVLLSAYQCGPGMGSVSQIGWEWYQRLCSKASVTLVTHVRNRRALEKSGAPIADSEVIYIDSEWFAKPLYRFAERCFPRSEHPVFLIGSLDFFVYDWLMVRSMLQKQRKGQSWDVVHSVTPVSPWAGTRLHKLKSPLVLGPWNGGLKSPKTFPEIMRAESGWLYSIRNLGKWIHALTGTLRKASLILIATRATKETIPEKYQGKCQFMLENAVDTDLFTEAPYPLPASSNNPLQIIFVGRLLPFKGVSMLLEAIKALPFPVRLQIIGDGSEGETLKTQVNQLQLSNCVDFLGNRTLQEIAHLLTLSHVFCLPSVRESGGAVLLEAMAAARPIITIDYGGPGEIVDREIGEKIPATGKKEVIEGLIEALTDAVKNPDQWAEKGRKGRQRVEKFYSWHAKIETAVSSYMKLIEPNA